MKAEAARLRLLWDAFNERSRTTQAAFGEEHEIGNQSAVGQFLRGESPLSPKAARGFAKGLGCQIDDFSPRLAAMENAWPFDLVERERYEALSLPMRHKAQVRLDDYITELLAEQERRANGTYS